MRLWYGGPSSAMRNDSLAFADRQGAGIRTDDYAADTQKIIFVVALQKDINKKWLKHSKWDSNPQPRD